MTVPLLGDGNVPSSGGGRRRRHHGSWRQRGGGLDLVLVVVPGPGGVVVAEPRPMGVVVPGPGPGGVVKHQLTTAAGAQVHRHVLVRRPPASQCQHLHPAAPRIPTSPASRSPKSQQQRHNLKRKRRKNLLV